MNLLIKNLLIINPIKIARGSPTYRNNPYTLTPTESSTGTTKNKDGNSTATTLYHLSALTRTGSLRCGATLAATPNKVPSFNAAYKLC
jgi:hypothetical protein